MATIKIKLSSDSTLNEVNDFAMRLNDYLKTANYKYIISSIDIDLFDTLNRTYGLKNCDYYRGCKKKAVFQHKNSGFFFCEEHAIKTQREED